jgi:PAS domain S-box-containing protein
MGSVLAVRRSADGPSVTPSLRDTLLLRERALQATTVSVVITDSRLPDNPVVWVNNAFRETTGYDPGYAIGRNCRFLQGPDTDPATVAEMRLAIEDARSCSVTILNYRSDGSTFWNSVTTAPVHDDDGAVIGFIGMQVDVSDRVLAQQERDERLRAEHTARLTAEKAQRTLSLLADVNDRLISTFDLGKAMHALVDLLVPRFADGCAIDLVGEASAGSDKPQRIAAASTEETEETDDEVGDPSLVGRVLRTKRPVSIYDPADPDAQSLLVVPAIGHEGVLGALTFVSGQPQSYEDEHLELALEIGRRVALAIEWCRLYERERRAASILTTP